MLEQGLFLTIEFLARDRISDHLFVAVVIAVHDHHSMPPCAGGMMEVAPDLLLKEWLALPDSLGFDGQVVADHDSVFDVHINVSSGRTATRARPTLLCLRARRFFKHPMAFSTFDSHVLAAAFYRSRGHAGVPGRAQRRLPPGLPRIAHLVAFFGREARASALTTYQIRQYQLARRAAGAATGTINRETSALHRMGTLAVHWGWLDTVPGFPDRLRENPPRQGFFEHPEYLAVRARLPAPWQDILDLAYYSGWRKNEILGLTWDELDEAGGVIRLSPARSKTLVGRILPISQPIAEALARRRARRDPDSPLVFHRDGIPVRRWRTAWRTACQAAGVPTRFLHDCRRTAARNLIRASVPERVAMLLTGHKTRAIFDRYNIINEQELLEAGDQLVAYLAQHAQATPRGGRPHPARTAAPRTAPPLRLVRRTTA